MDAPSRAFAPFASRDQPSCRRRCSSSVRPRTDRVVAARLARAIGAVFVLTSAVMVTVVAGTSQTATAATSTVSAYWLVASDGGIFALGRGRVLWVDGGSSAQRAHRGHGRDQRQPGLLAGCLRRRDLRLR